LPTVAGLTWWAKITLKFWWTNGGQKPFFTIFKNPQTLVKSAIHATFLIFLTGTA